MATEVVNARIADTFLGYEDHGIFSFAISLDYGGTRQGFGHFSLDAATTKPTIEGILKAVGVHSWEELKNKYVRVRIEDSMVRAIAPLLGGRYGSNQEWFDPKEVFDAAHA